MTDLRKTSLRDSHLFSSGPKRVLSLDGGGVRGIISLAFLERIETLLRERANNPNLRLCDYFDLIGGTSTGSFIATALAFGFEATSLIEIYLALSSEGFERAHWIGGILSPKFRAESLAAGIRSHFGTETLGSEKILCGLGIVAKRLDTGSMWLFHNNPHGQFFSGEGAAFTPNRDFPLVNLIRASTAAPTYFEPEYIEIAPGVAGTFVDGAVSPHNNPALLLLMLATLSGYGFRWPLGPDNLMIVSIGTGAAAAGSHASAMRHEPAAMLAVSALESLMVDCTWLIQTLMQWMSSSPTSWQIDSEIGDLIEDQIGEKGLLHYLRYDAPLEAAWLENKLGLTLLPSELSALGALDRPDLAPRLLDIGRRAAQDQVLAEHFPAGFDRLDTASETRRE
jgi:hypothetical protein